MYTLCCFSAASGDDAIYTCNSIRHCCYTTSSTPVSWPPRRRVCCVAVVLAPAPPPTPHCSVWRPGADTTPAHPPTHQQRQRHLRRGICPVCRMHDTRQMHTKGRQRNNQCGCERLEHKRCICYCHDSSATRSNTNSRLWLVATKPTVGIACVLTHTPAPSGRLGSAQRLTASSSDSGSTSGSSSLKAAAAAAGAPVPARCC